MYGWGRGAQKNFEGSPLAYYPFFSSFFFFFTSPVCRGRTRGSVFQKARPVITSYYSYIQAKLRQANETGETAFEATSNLPFIL